MVSNLEIMSKLESMHKETNARMDRMEKKLEDIIQIKTTLYGADGDKTGGLCKKVEDNSREIGNTKNLYLTIAGVLGAVAGYLATLIPK